MNDKEGKKVYRSTELIDNMKIEMFLFYFFLFLFTSAINVCASRFCLLPFQIHECDKRMNRLIGK